MWRSIRGAICVSGNKSSTASPNETRAVLPSGMQWAAAHDKDVYWLTYSYFSHAISNAEFRCELAVDYCGSDLL
jgi:hypothetical protein